MVNRCIFERCPIDFLYYSIATPQSKRGPHAHSHLPLFTHLLDWMIRDLRLYFHHWRASHLSVLERNRNEFPQWTPLMLIARTQNGFSVMAGWSVMVLLSKLNTATVLSMTMASNGRSQKKQHHVKRTLRPLTIIWKLQETTFSDATAAWLWCAKHILVRI